MCRSIKVLRKMDPPATEADTRAAALQFVRKISGFHNPAKKNEAIFNEAVEEIAAVADRLLQKLSASA
jgi:hypothetical protein